MCAAALDPAALERELEALRRQRLEASQRVRASRQPPIGLPSHARNAPGDAPGGRPPFGPGRFGPERGFPGPPGPRSDGPRPAGFRDGPSSSRLGGGPTSKGPFGPPGHGGPPRGRFDSGAPSREGNRGAWEPGADHGRDRDGPNGSRAAEAPPAAPRRRAVLSMVVSERPPQADDGADGGHEHDRDRTWGREEGREGAGGQSREAWRDHDGERGRGANEDRSAVDRHEGRSFNPRDNHDPEHDHERGGGGSGGRGHKRLASEATAPPPPAAGSVADDPDSRKRARRLLGRALLGTLQRFRQEDAQFQASDAAARRAELARKAEEKAVAESERLRRQAAEERSRKRQEELDALMDLNLATDVKVLELMYAKKLARRRALGAFLRADGVPTPPTAASKGVPVAPVMQQPQPVYWQPASHCSATLAVLERQKQELRDWEEAVLAELELEKDGLRQRAQARRQGIVERRQRAAEARAVAGGAAAGGAEEEAEDHEALEAVELEAHSGGHGADGEHELEPEGDADGEARRPARGGDREGNGRKAGASRGDVSMDDAGGTEADAANKGEAEEAEVGAAAAAVGDRDESDDGEAEDEAIP